MLRIHVPRQSAALGIALRSKLTSYLVPQATDLAKVVDISGNGIHAPYSAGAPLANQFTSKPDAIAQNGSVGQALTPILAAARPVTMTLQLMCKVTNQAGTYVAGVVPEADMFFRAVTNDVRAYVICADGSGNFIVSGAGLVLNSWHDFTFVCAPNLVTFYIDGLVIGTVAKSVRGDANPKWQLGYSGSQTYGAGLIYLGTALTADQVKQNGKYLRITHGYP